MRSLHGVLGSGLVLLLSACDPMVVPIDEEVAGHGYGEWTAQWWQWIGAIDAANNPLADATGVHCDLDQAGPVWFLAGGLGGSVQRECSIPPDKHVFFPLLNGIAFNNAGESLTVDELRAGLGALIDAGCGLELTLDGEVLEDDLTVFRAISPEMVIEVPEDDIFGLNGDTIDPGVSDGFWIMLTPLPPGEHELTFGGAVCDAGGDPIFEVDLTYHLEVGP
jgi:hypothetical protein